MTTFFTADLHLGHATLLTSAVARPRPFASIAKHDEALIVRWNETVRSNSDDVYVLGDFALGLDADALERPFRRLRGRKHLIIGNHDPRRTLRLPWSSPPADLRRIAVDAGGHRYDVTLCHYPMRAWNRIHHGALHLYGHTHGSLPGTRRSCDVGVDVWDFRPVTLDEVLDQMALSDTWPEELAPAMAPGEA
ncbi:metallophosphoesterase [Methylorubrum sp. B1-46]|uniref:metallophosphoesterase n=1 Tax=Methylorubrum sp. B1-46 TaxID=2897334 RepID=UPI00351CFA15